MQLTYLFFFKTKRKALLFKKSEETMGFCGSSLCSGSGLPESEIYDGLTLTIENWTLLPHKKSAIFNKSEERKRFCGSSWCGGFPREWNLWWVGKWRAVKTGRGYLRNILQISCPFLFILLDYSFCLIHIPLCRFLYLWIILQVLLEIFPSNLCVQNLTVFTGLLLNGSEFNVQ